jgi:hypothetical protein
MRLLALIAIPFCLIQIQPASADCVEINRQASVWRAAFVFAKEDYTREAAAALSTTERTGAIGVASIKMKIAIDGLIEVLNRSMVEGCFGADAAVWRDIISKLKVEGDAIEKNIQSYLDKWDANAKEPR